MLSLPRLPAGDASNSGDQKYGSELLHQNCTWVSGFHIKKKQDPFVQKSLERCSEGALMGFWWGIAVVEKEPCQVIKQTNPSIENHSFWKTRLTPVAYNSLLSALVAYLSKHLKRLGPFKGVVTFAANAPFVTSNVYLGVPGNKNQMHAKDEDKQPGWEVWEKHDTPNGKDQRYQRQRGKPGGEYCMLHAKKIKPGSTSFRFFG